MVSARAIDRLTAHIWLYRLWRYQQRHYEVDRLREMEMALELKGLKANMQKLNKRIDTLNQLASAGDTKGADLERALTEVGAQLHGHLDDLTFAANMMGNGSGDSGEGEERPKPPASAEQPKVPPIASVPTASPPVSHLNALSNLTISPETHTRNSAGEVIERTA